MMLPRPCVVAAISIAILVTCGVARAAPASAAPSPSAAAPPARWADLPAVLDDALAPVAGALRTCVGGRLPRTIAIDVRRGRDGATVASLPLPGLGIRGPTRQERCLGAAVARIGLPSLPPRVTSLVWRHRIGAAGAPAPRDPALAAWRDLPGALDTLLDASHLAALARCTRAQRTVRLTLDLRRGATRVWLPDWQFHVPGGDGSTPPSARPLRACLARVVRGWHPPPLPGLLGGLELAVDVAR